MKISHEPMNLIGQDDRTAISKCNICTTDETMSIYFFSFSCTELSFPLDMHFLKRSFIFLSVQECLVDFDLCVMPLPVFGIIIHTCIPVVGRSSVHHLLRAHANCRVPANFSGPLFFSLLYATNAALIQCHIPNNFSRCPLVDNQVARKTSFAETIIRARFWLHMKIICIFFLANRSGAHTARSIRSLIGCLCHGWMPSPFGNL